MNYDLISCECESTFYAHFYQNNDAFTKTYVIKYLAITLSRGEKRIRVGHDLPMWLWALRGERGEMVTNTCRITAAQTWLLAFTRFTLLQSELEHFEQKQLQLLNSTDLQNTNLTL